jgi:muramoyltetrapeptide carboxypeptidase LdcA involved in peptidoglycan recycling
MIPKKLNIDDEIRIIAPARSLSIITQESIELATKQLEELGFKVTFGKHVKERDDFDSSSIESRIEDIHKAFTDKNVKAIITVIGGFNCNQLLKYLDYNLIKKNPKILCGYSDITSLQNAIYKKTGLVSYSGPHYSTFGMKKGFEYCEDYFKKCVINSEPFIIIPSKEWSDDEWYIDQEERKFIQNNGFYVINEGESTGTIIGANLCTFNLLQGTEFMPSLKDSILFLEDDENTTPALFDRDLQSLIHQPGFDSVKGIIIGRFQKKSNMTPELIKQIIKNKKELNHILVIADVDFGHTSPMITFPIGGKCKIIAKSGQIKIKITEH